ncbi:metallophosphoesterase [Virgibacillus ndiopensis]|uniref:metallophosphoesterase n=1 Tax=Virgibacillus ndiopensis TaxID=2004408 RepID=UPI000C07FC8E|nr:metallophosphoesterase [Virgibacillus ndiopensis]
MIYLLILGCCIFLFTLYMAYKAHHDTIDYLEITDRNLPEGFSGFRLFFISDIHRRQINENTLQLIKGKIDIVIIGGDLTEKGVPIKRTQNYIKKLKQWNKPIYFIWGNNDYEAFPDTIYHLLIQEGVIILANSSKDIVANNGDILSLLGLDCCKYQEAHLDQALQGAKGTYNLLLTHAPSAFYDLNVDEQQVIHTVLAGHTHGGQIRILGFGLYEPGGFQVYQGTNILISEGYGYTTLPFRLGTKSECHVITFKRNE